VQLLEEDERYLGEKAYTFELVPDGDGGCLIIKGYALAPGKYDRDTVDLMICIPKGYNDAKLDNFYIDPPIHPKGSNEYPQSAAHFEDHAGRNWQRFSRHLDHWRAGIDTLQNFIPLINRELQNKP
jgi:hypothetical protein